MATVAQLVPGRLEAKVAWDKQVVGAFTSSEGSGGVCFINTDVGAFVVKGSMLVVQELFSSLLLRALSVPTAAMRVVDSDEPEWSSIKSCVRRAILFEKGEGNSSRVQTLNNMLSGPLLRAQLLILELVPGRPLEGNAEAKTLLSLAAAAEEKGKRAAQQHLQDVGEIAVVDIYLNNYDRIPLPCWDNDGNAGNLMVTDARVVAIDSIVNTVDLTTEVAKKRHELFLSKASKLLEDVVAANSAALVESCEAYQAIRTFVFNCSGYSITIDDFAEVRVGMLRGIVKVARLTETTIVEDLHAHMSKMFPNSWEQGWAKGCQSINVDDIFLKAAKMINKDEVGKVQAPSLVLPSLSTLSGSDSKNVPYARQPKAVVTIKKTTASNQRAGATGKGGLPPVKRPPLALNSNLLKAGLKGLAKRDAPVEKKTLMVQQTPKSGLGADALMLESKVEEFVKYECGDAVSSKLLKLDREGSHEEILRLAVAHKVDLVAFDFDQTLTEPKKNKNDKTAGPRMRGGTSSLKAIQDLHRNGVDMIIITATKPGRDAAASVAAEACKLGLGKEFNADKRHDLDALNSAFKKEGNLSELSDAALTDRLSMLMMVHTRLRGIDLWRVSSRSVKRGASGIIESFCTRTLQMESSVDQFDSLGTLSTPYKVPKAAAESVDLSLCLQEYLKRVETFGLEQLFLEVDNKDNFTGSGMSSKALVSRLEVYAKQLGLAGHVIRALSHGFAEDIKTEKGVMIAKAGKVFCSGYNKSEALEWYVKSCATRPRRVLFVDDNTDNVFNLFMAFKSGELVEDIFSVWFQPPVFGQMETGSGFANAVVKKAALVNSVLDFYNNGSAEMKALSLEDAMSSSVNVLIIQAAPTTIKHGAKHLRSKLGEVSGKRVDFVVLPEGYIRGAVLDGDDLGEIQPYCEIAKEFEIYLVCGTMVEKKSSQQYYITSLFIGPEGTLQGKYRKRKVHDYKTQAQGESVGVYDTKHGKVGIVICLDAEDDTVIQETLEAGAQIIFNPTHIPTTTGSSGNGKVWTFAMQSMQRRFEKICADKGCFVVRCDTSYPTGLGSSQMIGPLFTETVPSSSDETMFLKLARSSEDQERIKTVFSGVPKASYARTEAQDNIGARLRINYLRSTVLGSKPYFKFVYNKPKGDLAIYDAAKELSCKLMNLQTFRPEDAGPWISKWIDPQKQAPQDDRTHSIAALDSNGECAVAVSTGKIQLLRLPHNRPEPVFSFASQFSFEAVAVNVASGLIAARSSEGILALLHFSHNNVACKVVELLEEGKEG